MKFLVGIVIFYFVFKFIGRIIFPMFLKRVVNKFEQKVKDQQEQQAPKSQQKVGETVIDKKPSAAKDSDNSVGEYVDYEEVD
ncbi:MAG: bacteriorhodopsin [Candidatus Azotimanducaceae bacterium]|jgi:bacteriorhodopsin